MKIISTFLGGVFVFLLATSCCWLPWLAIVLGSSVIGASGFSEKLDTLSVPFLALGIGLLAYSGYSFWQKKKRAESVPEIISQSRITCPKCGFSKTETMPTDACQYFYDCANCKAMLKPLAGDCCVFCSYGIVKCPPIQAGDKSCC